MLKRFVENIGAKTTKFNDYKIKLHKGGTINVKFIEDPVATKKNKEKVPPNTP